MNEVVKYNSQMNEVAFRRFTAEELNMFFLFCTKSKENHDQKRFQRDHHEDLERCYRPPGCSDSGPCSPDWC